MQTVMNLQQSQNSDFLFTSESISNLSICGANFPTVVSPLLKISFYASAAFAVPWLWHIPSFSHGNFLKNNILSYNEVQITCTWFFPLNKYSCFHSIYLALAVYDHFHWLPVYTEFTVSCIIMAMQIQKQFGMCREIGLILWSCVLHPFIFFYHLLAQCCESFLFYLYIILFLNDRLLARNWFWSWIESGISILLSPPAPKQTEMLLVDGVSIWMNGIQTGQGCVPQKDLVLSGVLIEPGLQQYVYWCKIAIRSDICGSKHLWPASGDVTAANMPRWSQRSHIYQ